jgi:hypothetical protein
VAFWLRGRRRRYAAGGTFLVILITVGMAVAMTGNNATTGLVRLSSAPLGVNVAPWDGGYTTQRSLDVIQQWLRAAEIHQLRYGGGSYADSYDWQTNTSIRNCLPEDPSASFKSTCASSDALRFTQFSRQAKSVDADSFVTVNYGSGTPAEAAAWVSEAKDNPRNGVALWEVGNENYGCWEIDDELAGPPERYHGYKPSLYNTANADVAEQTCPQVREGDAVGTQMLATSYAVNARRFMRAMRAADTSARIGVPWAFGKNVQGAYVPDSAEWNNTVLQTDGRYVSFVDAHYYPFNFYGSTSSGNPTDMQVLQSLTKIPSLYASIRAELNAFAPGAAVVVGEAAVSSRETSTTCTPVGAVFAAGDALSWLAAGTQSVDWWYMNDGGNSTPVCDEPGSGLFTSYSPPTPESPYFGYLLASILAQPGAMLGKLVDTDPSDVLGFRSTLPSGKHAVAFININARSSEKVTFQPDDGLSGMLKLWRYSEADQNSNNSKVLTGMIATTSVESGVSLPAESVVVLETQ